METSAELTSSANSKNPDFSNCLPKFLLDSLHNLNMDDEEFPINGNQKLSQNEECNLNAEFCRNLQQNNQVNNQFWNYSSSSKEIPQLNRPSSSGSLRQVKMNEDNNFQNFYINNNTQTVHLNIQEGLQNQNIFLNNYPSNQQCRNNFIMNQKNPNIHFNQFNNDYFNNGNGGNMNFNIFNPIMKSHSNGFGTFSESNLNRNMQYMSNHQEMKKNKDSESIKFSNYNSLDSSNYFHDFSKLQHPKKASLSGNLEKILNKGSLTPNGNNYKIQGEIFKNPSKQRKSSFFNKNEKFARDEDYDNFEELIGNLGTDINMFVRTQKGSRILQKHFDKISPENLNILLEKLKGDFVFLMTDTYGNYLCQKLFQCCSSHQRKFILNNISKDFISISCNPLGTHSLQSLIEIINLKDEEDLVMNFIIGNEIKLAIDSNGTHVLQKIVSCFNEESRQLLNFEILNNFFTLVMDANGICVLKKFVNRNESLELKNAFMNKILENTLEIIQNPFGNYIIQHIVEEWGIDYCKNILNIIIVNMFSLSMQKFSSNVVEKCFSLVDDDYRKKMIKEIFNLSKICSLIKNKYGNFVLQKAILILKPEERKEIKDELSRKANITSNKEKTRLISLLETL